jgi:hypothetical protein
MVAEVKKLLRKGGKESGGGYKPGFTGIPVATQTEESEVPQYWPAAEVNTTAKKSIVTNFLTLILKLKDKELKECMVKANKHNIRHSHHFIVTFRMK